jgi:hypothetical protein
MSFAYLHRTAQAIKNDHILVTEGMIAYLIFMSRHLVFSPIGANATKYHPEQSETMGESLTLAKRFFAYGSE